MSNVVNNAGAKTVSGVMGRRLMLLLVTAIGVALFFLAAPLLIVFVVGMVPTVVAFICDRDREKYMAIAIGAGNLAGVIPFLIALAKEGPTLSHASAMVTDVFSIAMMYGAATAGWMLVMALPSVVAVYMNVMTENRIQNLRKNQQMLVEDWGAEAGVVDTPAGRQK